jgi:hypothetical protein
VPDRPDAYIQRLDGLDLRIEKATDRAPDDDRYHVFRDGELLNSFRSLTQAQALFRQLRDDSGWRPPERADLTPKEKLGREKLARDRLHYLDYWGSSHKFRGGGRPKRKQR